MEQHSQLFKCVDCPTCLTPDSTKRQTFRKQSNLILVLYQIIRFQFSPSHKSLLSIMLHYPQPFSSFSEPCDSYPFRLCYHPDGIAFLQLLYDPCIFFLQFLIGFLVSFFSTDLSTFGDALFFSGAESSRYLMFSCSISELVSNAVMKMVKYGCYSDSNVIKTSSLKPRHKPLPIVNH